jgi:hypothetical protein
MHATEGASGFHRLCPDAQGGLDRPLDVGECEQHSREGIPWMHHVRRSPDRWAKVCLPSRL